MESGSPPFQRIRELFDLALEQPASERAAFVSANSGGDGRLEEEVLSLLAAFDADPELLETPAIASLLSSTAATTASSDEAAGESVPAEGRLGSYRLVRRIGEGGMGAVYEAVRADGQFDKRVAVKLVRGGLHSEAVRRRFRREREILAQLDHPTIARLLDAGVTERGEPYFVMEYVEGEPLTTYCETRGLSVSERLELFLGICEGVQYAHRNLVVHCDLKPGNILVTSDGAVKLLDFGVSKLLRDSEPDTTGTLTRLGGRFVTPAYASPEQLRGERVTTSSDVYSLGVLLYELLCGQRPVELRGNSPVEIARALEVDPTRPSEVVATRETSGRRAVRWPLRRGKLPAELDTIALMALRKEPARRYASVEQLAADIRRFQAGLPVMAQGDAAAYRLRKFVRRHRAAVTAMLVLILSLGGGVAATSWEARRAERAAAQAQVQREKAESVVAFLGNMFRSADPRLKGRNVKVADILSDAAQRAQRELSGDPEVQAGVETAIGMAYSGLGLYPQAAPLFRAALRIHRQRDGRLASTYVGSLEQLADLEFQEQRTDSAGAYYQQALTALERESRPDSLQIATALDGLGEVYNWRGEYATAAVLQRRALALRRKLAGPESEGVAVSLNDLAVVLGQQARWSEAEPLLREALGILIRLHGRQHPDVAEEMSNLAFVLEQQKNYPAADSFYRAALRMRTRLLGPDHPEVAWTQQNYANMLFDLGDYKDAIAGARRVLALRGRVLPDTHILITSALQLLGRSMLATGHPAKAETLLRESLRLRRKVYPPDHWLVASAESVLGGCLVRRHKLAEAKRLLLDADTLLRASLGPDHPLVRENAARLADLYAASGDSARAARYRALAAAPVH